MPDPESIRPSPEATILSFPELDAERIEPSRSRLALVTHEGIEISPEEFEATVAAGAELTTPTEVSHTTRFEANGPSVSLAISHPGFRTEDYLEGWLHVLADAVDLDLPVPVLVGGGYQSPKRVLPGREEVANGGRVWWARTGGGERRPHPGHSVLRTRMASGLAGKYSEHTPVPGNGLRLIRAGFSPLKAGNSASHDEDATTVAEAIKVWAIRGAHRGTPGFHSHNVIGDTGEIVAQVVEAGAALVADPYRAIASSAGIPISLDTDPVLGFRRVARKSVEETWPSMRRDGEPLHDGPTDGPVATFDTSVLLAGVVPERFAPGELLMMSAIVAFDYAGSVDVDGEKVISTHIAPPGVPNIVAVDIATLRFYGSMLAIYARGKATPHPQLNRCDVYSAAFAITHKVPLYTCFPERYKGIRLGLKLIKYGPIRNPTAVLKNPPQP